MAGDPSSNGTAVQRVDWSALRAYIAGKEAFEAEHGRPAPLTDHEVSAIAILLRPAPRPEPDLGKTNWLGLLNHFQQVRNQKVTFTDEARQEQGLGKAKELRWACSATFDSTGDVFPQPGYGMDAGEDVSRGGAGPSFPGKKDAKQWAAKAACEWLIDNGHMMPSGDLPKFPKPFAPAASAALAAAASASAPAPAPAPSPSPSRGVSSGSVLPSKRSPPSSPPTESSADASRKKQDTNQPPKTSPSLPTQAPTASNSTSSSLPSHQASPPTSTQPSRAPKSTLPLNVTASPTSAAAQDSTTTSTASTPSLGGAGVPITTAAAAATPQSQVPTPAISPVPTSTPARVSTPVTPGQESATATTSAERRVRDLCAQLHFPVPRYVLTPDPALEDFWDGRADFDGNPRIPDDLGTVRRVLHKKAARERMADAIVIWLEGEVVKRERTAKLLLGK
ncbi:hypothetical protein CPAR01_14074 [Colletotrichum paranaense]|uniref:DRBM domain-containing protein n=1 Tax=Colletotrichum paranaense TaxID=1914294 RepID=A0ABQ9S331_9PEZI|nr:uncharacterized protein CPAR01_14074 [Colletotrichum paranaense]KAK1523221.1 hypothetical protein CPAR01_14074 [Colletotrichum paranaense]